MFIRIACAAVLSVAFSSITVPSLADDWVAKQLRGPVFAFSGGEWVPLKRGEVISDDRPIRSLKAGHATFVRDEETIILGPETQIQIVDGKGSEYTTVKQYFGKVTIEAEVRNVQHFEVKTPFMAAVVKGTKFVVTTGEDSSNVKVNRGHVAVEDSATHYSTTISAGQSASTGDNTVLTVEGAGDLPVVVNAKGQPVEPPAARKSSPGNSDNPVNDTASESGKPSKGKEKDKDDDKGPGKKDKDDDKGPGKKDKNDKNDESSSNNSGSDGGGNGHGHGGGGGPGGGGGGGGPDGGGGGGHGGGGGGHGGGGGGGHGGGDGDGGKGKDKKD